MHHSALAVKYVLQILLAHKGQGINGHSLVFIDYVDAIITLQVRHTSTNKILCCSACVGVTELECIQGL